MQKELTCIVCPIGCSLKVILEGETVTEVTGNTCKRGEEYAKSECINPVRVVTTTISTQSGDIVAVKTDRPIPRKIISECMKHINALHPLNDKIFVGSVICENILNTGANVVVTAPLRR